jgi:probable HAF family extracellular repeat protein
MILNHCFKVRSFALATALSFGLGLTSSASADSYLIDTNSGTWRTWTESDPDLPHTVGGGVRATDLNNAGQVTGSIGMMAFITGPNGSGMKILENSWYQHANTINDIGQVAGSSRFDGAFFTGPNGEGVINMGLGGEQSWIADINDSGQMIGGSNYGPVPRRFITGPNGVGMTDLGTLGGSISEAYGINDAGQVVGESGGHAFITGPNGMGMTDLGTLGGTYSNALDINDAGQVVGFSDTAGASALLHHAFSTSPCFHYRTQRGGYERPWHSGR